MGFVEVIVLLISSITLFLGYFIGKKEGLSNGYSKGIYEGAIEINSEFSI